MPRDSGLARKFFPLTILVLLGVALASTLSSTSMPGGEPVFFVSTLGGQTPTTPVGTILSSPAQFVDQDVTVTGELQEGSWWLAAPSGEKIELKISGNAATAARGFLRKQVTVSGTVRFEMNRPVIYVRTLSAVQLEILPTLVTFTSGTNTLTYVTITHSTSTSSTVLTTTQTTTQSITSTYVTTSGTSTFTTTSTGVTTQTTTQTTTSTTAIVTTSSSTVTTTTVATTSGTTLIGGGGVDPGSRESPPRGDCVGVNCILQLDRGELVVPVGGNQAWVVKLWFVLLAGLLVYAFVYRPLTRKR